MSWKRFRRETSVKGEISRRKKLQLCCGLKLQSSKMSSIQAMPDELLGRIFLMSTKEAKLECRTVCQKWESILDKYLLTSKILLCNNTMKPTLTCHVPIKTLNVRSLTAAKFVSMVQSRLGSNFGTGNGGIQELIFPRVLKRKVENGRCSVSTENLNCILHLCASSIKYLFLDFNTLMNNRLESGTGLTFSNLKHLKICFGSDESERENLRELANNFQLPHVEKLQLFNGFQRGNAAIADVYQSFAKIAEKCGCTLRVLNLVHPLLSSSVLEQDSVMTIIPKEGLPKIEADLEEVYISLDREETSDRRTVLELLHKQRNLKLLHLSLRKESQLVTIGLSEIIAKNANTLEGIDLIGPKRGERLEFFRHVEDGVWAAFTRLRTLRIINYKLQDLPLSLPSSLQELMLWGCLSNNEAQVMRTIRLRLPNLQRLDYYDVEKSATGNDILQEEVELLVRTSRNLKEMFIYKYNFDSSFLTNIENPSVVLRAMNISSKWCWPLKKIVLKRAYHVAIQR